MRRSLALVLIWSLLAVPMTAASAAPSADSSISYQFDNERSTMTVYGSSNVRDWKMDVTQLNGRVTLAPQSGTVPAIQNVEVKVPVEHLVSDKDRLERHAYDALKKEAYPTISFSASDVQVAKAEADSFSVTANGRMTIKGNTHATTVTAKGIQKSDGTIRVVGEHRLKMSTYDVERPSLMFGAIKVTDPVRITFDVTLVPSSTATSATEE